MKESDVRLFNLVDYYGTICEIHGIQFKSVAINSTDSGKGIVCEFDKIEPIPLTEEWINKLGLLLIKAQCNSSDHYKTTETLYYHFYQAWFKIRVNEDSIFLCYDFDYTIMNVIELKYVHQLQNLYFALAGKELGIK